MTPDMMTDNLARAQDIIKDLRARLEAVTQERDALQVALTGKDHVGAGPRVLKRAFARAEKAEVALAAAYRMGLEAGAKAAAFDAKDKFAPMVRGFDEAFEAGCLCVERSIRALPVPTPAEILAQIQGQPAPMSDMSIVSGDKPRT